MHILLTGSSGSLGRATLPYLLSQSHTVTSIDLVPLPSSLLDSLPSSQSGAFTHHVLNLCDYPALDALFARIPKVDGLIHLGAIPDPLRHDARQVHGDNVVGAYNVIKTAIDHGVERVVQASSVNAVGLSYTPEGMQTFDELPIDETADFRPRDPYALSKQ
jgi:nucleoside-diphosphate-sugar epimerase